jgi:predicted ATPase
MKINKILINNLFELFDHEISLKTNERITIIHGPNGVGKTTLLKLIRDLFSSKFENVCQTPFQQLIIFFDNQTVLTIDKAKNAQTPTIQLMLQKPHQKRAFKWECLGQHLSRRPFQFIENVAEHVDSGAADFPQNPDETLLFPEVVERSWKILQALNPTRNVPEWLTEMIDSQPVYFIQTQRLFALPEDYEGTRRQTRTVVEKYAEDLAHRIQEKQRQAGNKAASLDRTLPHRLLENQIVEPVTAERIKEKYQAQTQYRKRLMAAGLVDEEEQIALPSMSLDENLAKVLWYSLNDIDEKLNVFDEFLQRIELFKEIINSRFLYNTFCIDKASGFVFTNKKGHTVPLNTLSSGEQHELILVYELLFKVKPKSLILIDEPELSLHVTWQHQFVADLTKISALADIDFIIATHSPSIVHHRRDLMAGLGETVAC